MGLQRPLSDVLCLQTINVCAWLIQNAYLLGKGCAWFDLFPSYLSLVSWSCFNFVRLLWARQCCSPEQVVAHHSSGSLTWAAPVAELRPGSGVRRLLEPLAGR